MKNFVSFKTEGTAKVKIYWVEGGTDNRQMAIFNSTGDVVTKTEVTAAKNDPVVSTLELADAGTYYLGGLENNNYIFKVVVTDTVGGGNTPVAPRKDWSEVAAPVIGEVAQDGANVTVPFTMVLGNDGADKVSVVMTDASGNTETKGYALEGEGGKVSFSPDSLQVSIHLQSQLLERMNRIRLVIQLSLTLLIHSQHHLSAVQQAWVMVQ
ncbi:MAG: hypothetical protein ACLR7D_12030 [Lachnospira eligens]